LTNVDKQTQSLQYSPEKTAVLGDFNIHIPKLIFVWGRVINYTHSRLLIS